MTDMVWREILPAVEAYVREITETGLAKKKLSDKIPTVLEENLAIRLSDLAAQIAEKAEVLESTLAAIDAGDGKDITTRAFEVKEKLLPAMKELRTVCDEAESLTAEKAWPYPTYAALLFGVE